MPRSSNAPPTRPAYSASGIPATRTRASLTGAASTRFLIHGCGGIGQSYAGSCGDVPGNSYFDPVIKDNGKFAKTSGYCIDVFFAQAEKWIESLKGK